MTRPITGTDGGQPRGTQLYLESGRIDTSICPNLFEEEATPEYRVLQLTSAGRFDSLKTALNAHLEEVNDPSEAAVIMLTPNAERDLTMGSVGEETKLYGLEVDPQDLTGISIAFSRILKEWSEVSGPMRICLRGAESLFAFHSGDLIYRFLNTVLANLQGAGATVHMHLQPSITDERTVAMLESLFDRVVETGEEEPPAERNPAPDNPKPESKAESTTAENSDAATGFEGDVSAVEMTAAEIDDFLESNGYGILSLDGETPYGIPQSYGYDASERIAYFQLGLYDDSEKGRRLRNSTAVSLAVVRYSRPDQWRSVLVDGHLTRIDRDEAIERGALDAFDAAELASVDVFARDPATASFEWFVLEPRAFSGRKSTGSL